MLEVGKVNKLKVNRETTSGYYLCSKEDDYADEVFMPASLAPLKIKVGQDITAFIYEDSKGRLIATSDIPFAAVGEYALLSVIDTRDFGAFMDWGIDKDLLVPGNEQKIKMRTHDKYLVRVCREEGTNRIYGTSKIGKYVEASDFDIMEGDPIRMVPIVKTDLGFKVIINRKFIGMIYHNEIFSPIIIGEMYDGVVKKLRTDGLVDAALQIQGIKNLVDAKDKIIEMLEDCNGESFLNDKSTPAEIKRMLGMSKKTFKNALGMLYKERKVLISKEGIKLNKK